jgi:hypothetical protein
VRVRVAPAQVVVTVLGAAIRVSVMRTVVKIATSPLALPGRALERGRLNYSAPLPWW